MNRYRDNLTANCPHFKARTDYQSGHWITCAMGHKGFRSAWERNQYYKTICCQCGRGCELTDEDRRKQ